MGLEIHYIKLFNTIEYYEAVLNSSYEEMINLIENVCNINDLKIIINDYDCEDDNYEIELEILNNKGILLFTCNKYYYSFIGDKERAKKDTYYKLFQSDFFKGLQK